MVETIQIQFAAILGLSAVAQWLGWRFKIPSILILLTTGFLIGPVFGLIDIKELFGDLLKPLVSASVAILLFEGGLTLRMKELRHDGSVVFRLVTIGVVVCFALATWLSVELLGFELKTAALFGALLSLTGPTVIGPVLRTVRPKGSVKHIAKWEGILNDPIAVLLAVFVFELLFLNPASPSEAEFWSHLGMGILKTLVVSGLCAWGGARMMIYLIRHRMLPEFLHNLMIMAIVIVTFVFSNYVQEEAGLVTATLLGMILANQRNFRVDHIVHFKENLVVLIISSVFIVLAANVDPAVLSHLSWRSFAFVALLILVVRPLSVVFSTVGSNLPWSQRILLMFLAPRGIVAVALTSVFVLKLSSLDVPRAEDLFAEMLIVVVGTVIFYGSTVAFVASKLGLTNLTPSGLLMVGASPWAIHMGRRLKDEGIAVLFVDTNPDHVAMARQYGLRAETGDVLSNTFLENLDLSEIGHAICATPNFEVNTLAKQMLMEYFDRRDILIVEPDHIVEHEHDERKRPFDPAFGVDVTHEWLHDNITDPKVFLVKTVEESDPKRGLTDGEIPLFGINNAPDLKVFTQKYKPTPKPGWRIVSIPVALQKEMTLRVERELPLEDEEK